MHSPTSWEFCSFKRWNIWQIICKSTPECRTYRQLLKWLGGLAHWPWTDVGKFAGQPNTLMPRASWLNPFAPRLSSRICARCRTHYTRIRGRFLELLSTTRPSCPPLSGTSPLREQRPSPTCWLRCQFGPSSLLPGVRAVPSAQAPRRAPGTLFPPGLPLDFVKAGGRAVVEPSHRLNVVGPKVAAPDAIHVFHLQ
jgi:hypothetical protein